MHQITVDIESPLRRAQAQCNMRPGLRWNRVLGRIELAPHTEILHNIAKNTQPCIWEQHQADSQLGGVAQHSRSPQGKQVTAHGGVHYHDLSDVVNTAESALGGLVVGPEHQYGFLRSDNFGHRAERVQTSSKLTFHPVELRPRHDKRPNRWRREIALRAFAARRRVGDLA